MLVVKIHCCPLFLLYLCSVSAQSAAEVGLSFYPQEKKRKVKGEKRGRKEKGGGEEKE